MLWPEGGETLVKVTGSCSFLLKYFLSAATKTTIHTQTRASNNEAIGGEISFGEV